MRSWKPTLGLVLFALISTDPAFAVTYNVDMFQGGEPNTGAFVFGNFCEATSCANNTFYSPVHDFPAGSTVNLGTYTSSAIEFSGFAGPIFIVEIIMVSLQV